MSKAQALSPAFRLRKPIVQQELGELHVGGRRANLELRQLLCLSLAWGEASFKVGVLSVDAEKTTRIIVTVTLDHHGMGYLN